MFAHPTLKSSWALLHGRLYLFSDLVDLMMMAQVLKFQMLANFANFAVDIWSQLP